MSKYTRTITQTINGEDRGLRLVVDVYDVLRAFAVTDPAIQHAIKKLLCTGIRGHKDSRQDLEEAVQSIERALDAVKVEGLLTRPIDAEFEIVPPADPPQPECPFKIGDIIQHHMDIEDQAGTKWQIVGITSERLSVVNFDDHNDASHIERKFWPNYSRVGTAAPKAKEQPGCPFKVGDVIQFHDAAVSKTQWKIDRILSDRLHVTSDDSYQTPSQIDRQFWGNYKIVSQSESSGRELPKCPFDIGDVIRGIGEPENSKWKVERIKSDRIDVITYDVHKHPAHIEYSKWQNYLKVNPIDGTAVDKPQQTC